MSSSDGHAMCGITGFIAPQLGETEATALLKRMTDTLRHRGPDDEGYLNDPETGLGLGFRRLAVLDVSQLGHQPMSSASKRYTIIHNGEVYNFEELRRDLEAKGRSFRSVSDTEVLLAAFEEWGVESSVRRFNGMFAFALYDRKEQVLYLCRDRLGIKPLYYGWVGKTFVFASECNCFRHVPGFARSIDRGALALFLRHNYIPAPYSIYDNIFKLRPGHLLKIACHEDGNRVRPDSVPYWDLNTLVAEASPFNGGEQEAIERFEQLLSQAVRRRMLSDVPLGAFLSGGIDSSLVVALMQAQGDLPVRTFSIGFHEDEYNEAVHARKVAEHLGTDHTELYVTHQDAIDTIPHLANIYDEPFSDSSQVPVYLLSKLTRQEVTVALSGDGGDELFAGYPRYETAVAIWRRMGFVPKRARLGFKNLVTSLPTTFYDKTFGWAYRFMPTFGRPGTLGDKAHKFAGVLGFQTFPELYRRMVSHWESPGDLLGDFAEYPTVFDGPAASGPDDLYQKMMLMDTLSYLPDDILVKVDRASMAVSLEARVPLLDHNVVEFVWTLPRTMKRRGRDPKWLIKQLLYKHVPRELIERPKMGFGAPIAAWLRGPLRDWAEAQLSEERLRRDDLLDPKPIRQKWQEHVSGYRNWQYYLWDVLIFQAWKESHLG